MAAWLNRRSEELRQDIPQPDYVITDLSQLLEIDL
jgi:FMN phosphatase YigB (HAD superfamily)